MTQLAALAAALITAGIALIRLANYLRKGGDTNA